MHKINMTRGYGFLEEFLAKKRSGLANRLIPFSYRKGYILDIGCGAFPFFLLNTNFCKKCGLDKTVRRGYDAHFRDHNIKFVNHDMEKSTTMPFDSRIFDIVTMLAVVEHIEPAKLINVFKEIYRILRPGGMCVITTPAVCARPLLKLMADLRLVSPVEIREHKHAYGRRKIAYLLKDAGFAEDKMRGGYFFLNTWTTAIKWSPSG